ncbi:hypothetical protein ASG12_07510 [Williamsia sp. Leaf354]|uniref:hypothetical protein n=1 Tax=Williamsia sp. Leaf354 TaxID=1736349 RepID=UPI000700F570|nr:hypothetical protein [Williamsia sp. Leaf354]KQS00702.1 hypothetical protein ASG12_07510 [Williamsia sp. Leaf354]
MVIAILVLSAFVLGVGVMVKQTNREQSEQPAKRVGRAGITPIYKRSSPMDIGGGVGYLGGTSWSDGGSGGFDGGSCGPGDGGSGGGDSGGC